MKNFVSSEVKLLLFLSVAFMMVQPTAATNQANNTITYTATEKLPEVISHGRVGVHTDAFNTPIVSHEFVDGVGTIIFKDVVKTIGVAAFWGCEGLMSVTIPSSVKTIDDFAFNGCSSLVAINIPSAVTTIGISAFTDCTKLSSVTMPASVKTIGECAFSFCTSLTSVTIPSSVTTIGDYAFQSCKSLESVILPSSVSSIGRGAFYLCSKITEPIYNANCFAYLPTSYKGSYTIPDGIKQISGWAFKNCGLTTINIPSSVTTIDEGAFWNCYELSSITIPNSVQIIGKSAFATCISLTSFIIPSTVKTIGDYAFQFCRMSSITSYATTPPACGKKCFEGIGKSIPVYVPMYSISAYKQAEGWKEFTNILPIAADDVPIIEPIITTDDYSVTIIWPQNENADTYTIEITKDGELFCTLTFNRQGQLTIIAFAAPARGGSRNSSAAEMTSNGYKFTINGLEQGTEYTYAVIVKDASEQVIQTHSGKFITTNITNSATALEDLIIDKKAGNKFLDNNQLYIRHNGHLYTATGARVR